MPRARLKFFQFFIGESDVFAFLNLKAVDELLAIYELVLGDTIDLFFDSTVVLGVQQIEMDRLRRHRWKQFDGN